MQHIPVAFWICVWQTILACHANTCIHTRIHQHQFGNQRSYSEPKCCGGQYHRNQTAPRQQVILQFACVRAETEESTMTCGITTQTGSRSSALLEARDHHLSGAAEKRPGLWKGRGREVEKTQLRAMLSAWEHEPFRAKGAFSWKVAIVF